jgi:hypothetical protein
MFRTRGRPIGSRLGCEHLTDHTVTDGRTIVRRRTTRARRLLAGVMVVGALLAGHTLAVAQAEAVSGPTRVTRSSQANSRPLKRVAAVCPAGTRVVGGGGTVVHGRGQVVLQQLEPRHTASDDRFVVAAREDRTGYGSSWRLTAYALCTDPLPGQQITSNTLPASSDSLQSALAFCPSGQTQIGFGGRIDNGAGQVHITELFDFFGPPVGVTFLRAREGAGGYAGAWAVRPFAVCVDAAAVTGLVSVATVSPTSSLDKSAVVSCPPGTKVHSAGGALLSESGQLATGSLIIDQIAVDPSATTVTVRAVEDEAGTAESWMVRAVALCGP